MRSTSSTVSFRRFALGSLLLLGLAPSRALAQEPPLAVQLSGLDDPAETLTALAAELGMPVTLVTDADQADVAIAHRDAVTEVRVSRAGLPPLERELEDGPARPSRIALLVASMVHDESTEILELLDAPAAEGEVGITTITPFEIEVVTTQTEEIDAAPLVLVVEDSLGNAAAPAAGEPPLDEALETSVAGVDFVPFAGTSSYFLGRDRRNFSFGALGGIAGAVDGFALSGIADISRGDIRGVQIGGVTAIADGDIEGVQLGGAIAIATGDVRGAQLGSIVAVSAADIEGAQLGMVAITPSRVSGTQLGLLSVAGEEIRGVQGGMVAVAGGHLDGAQLGLVTVAAGSVEGAQLGTVAVAPREVAGIQAGVVAVGGSRLSGAQLGLVAIAPRVEGLQLGALTLSAERIDGVQIGLLAIAGTLSGTQLGLLNIAASSESDGESRGVQIGLLNISADADVAVGLVSIYGNGRTQLRVGAESSGVLMASALHGRITHNELGIGVQPFDRAAATINWAWGVRASATDWLAIDIDLRGAMVLDERIGRSDPQSGRPIGLGGILEPRVSANFELIPSIFGLYIGLGYQLSVEAAHGASFRTIALPSVVSASPPWAQEFTTSGDSVLVRGWTTISAGALFF